MRLQVVMKVIINNFNILGIEYCFLNELPDTLSPDTMIKLDDTSIRNIAAEIEDSQIERARVIKKLNNLEVSL